MRTIKSNISIVFTILLAIALISPASAVFWACFDRGEQINFCNPATPDRTCDSVLGCAYCMSTFNESKSCYNQAYGCNNIPFECDMIGGNHTQIDSEPPVLTLDYPENDLILTDRSVPLDITMNEKGSIYYLDNLDDRSRWNRLCRNCYSYDRKRSFKEGFNSISFMAEDVVGNKAYKNVSFFIDTRDPKINRVEPRKGFASGFFDVQFTEDNPVSLVLHYGNTQTGERSKELNIDSECTLEKKKYYCTTDVDLSDYDGEYIQYYFELEDVADQSTESKPLDLQVDSTYPVINSITQNLVGRRLDLSIKITELNFQEITYMDLSDPRAREKRLCSKLDLQSMCKGKISLSTGNHDIALQVYDKAGNSVGQNIVVNIN